MSYNILIVEDIAAARTLYKKALETEKYLITDTDRGMEAIRILKAKKVHYDLVILDIRLPDINGNEVLKQIREFEKDIPVLVLTAFSDKDMVIDMVNYGVNDYLIKPISIQKLRERVFQVLEGRKKDIITIKGKRTPNRKKEIQESNYLWTKETICPICGTKFESYNYKNKSQKLIKIETDFHEVYEKFDPIIYDIYVCPHCFFSAKPSEFNTLELKEIRALSKVTRESKYNFYELRDIDMGLESYQLLLKCYKLYKKITKSEYANIYIKIAWLYRDKKDNNNEKKYLELALKEYEKRYNLGERIEGKDGELKLKYMIAEISNRLEHYEKAMKYFREILQDKKYKEEKIYEKAQIQLQNMLEKRKKEKGD
ncbi:response regulator receiver domain-containing protein [Hypnocyclicus thermotrophus]|uniref:Response regulator receiver domain-containing protein n=1 Tax=Hypnocyclicus thermotrophus TaxID=1627895 RepID=A0AA46I4X5_9FUSO|nr:DUF2225 domain-containing protein [Hypnocyclicus thermotrophus]TDT67894.1 response regulator receiver domain-containing protein [Hypnocyclicus thermotrophus]